MMNASSYRRIGARQLEFLIIGTAIGSGLFVGSGQALHDTGPSLLLAYALCAAAVYIVTRCLGEMALERPDRPSFVHHVRAELGDGPGNVSGWGFWLATVMIGMVELTAVGLLCKSALPALPQWLGTVGAFVLLVAINFAPIRVFGWIEVAMSALKVAVILAFVLLAMIVTIDPDRLGLTGAGIGNLASIDSPFADGWHGFAQALPVALFAFGGVETLSLAAAETENATNAIPRAANGVIIRFVVFYLGATVALLVLLPAHAFVPGVSPFLTVLNRLHVPQASALLTILLVTCFLSSGNAVLFASARTLAQLSDERAAPHRMARSGHGGGPVAAVGVSAAAMSVAIVLNAALPRAAFGILMGVVSLITVINWVLIVFAELRYRRRRTAGYRPTFAVPWHPWSNIFTITLLVVITIIATVMA